MADYTILLAKLDINSACLLAVSTHQTLTLIVMIDIAYSYGPCMHLHALDRPTHLEINPRVHGTIKTIL